MKAKHLLLLSLSSMLVLASCGTYEMATVSEPYQSPHLDAIQGKSMSIESVNVYLESSRSDFDLRGTSVTVNGQAITLGGTYLDEDTDMKLGEVGVVDTNIFEKAGVDEFGLSSVVTEMLLNTLNDRQDFFIPINYDKLDLGYYSNRKLLFDFTTYPWSYTLDDSAPALESPFTSVAFDDSSADLALNVDIEIRSEILQILEDDVNIQNQFIMADHQPSQDDYYLTVYAFMKFTVVDRRTNEVVMDEKTRTIIPMAYGYQEQMYIPVQANDADQYSRFFRDFNFSGYTAEISRRLADSLTQGLHPFYRNLNQRVKVEEPVE